MWKPTAHGGRTPRNLQGRGILHVAVSGARSLPPWNSNTWHMYVAHDGYCEQYVDSAHRAYASGAANDDAFQIETAGGLGTSAVLNAERWTPAAAARIADIMRWLNNVDGTPLELLPDSKPGRRGWGPHRLGIQHSRGVGAVPGFLVEGGERWSSAVGKECPGDAKVRQVPEIIAAARSGAGGDDDMPTADEIVKAFLVHPAYSGGPQVSQVLKNLDQFVADVTRTGPDGTTAVKVPLRQEIADAKTLAADVKALIERLAAGGGGPVDVQAIADQLTIAPKQ